MSQNTDPSRDTKGRGIRFLFGAVIAAALIAVAVGFGLAALLMNIFQHKQEAANPFFRVVELNDRTVNPEIWGKNFPQQYDQYKRTVDMKRTRYGGSEAMPRTPTEADPRDKVSFSRIEEDPRLKTMWAGYAFAVDFREERGHAYMLDDQTYTARQQASPQVGTCIHCHASTYVPYKIAGGGDLIKGWEKMNPLPYFETKAEMDRIMKEDVGDPHGLYPVACIDCHDPQTMALRVTRPGFLEGIAAYKKAVEHVDNYDPNAMATRQEMRTYVCAQCHVEYYFKGKEKLLTYPWANGLKADQILEYYEESGFSDWTHALTGAGVLKAQHPEFETWSQGVHAQAGVACADCHMPYMRVGAQKISDHHVRSPLLNIANACQPCHSVPEEELKRRAEGIQDRTHEIRGVALDALVELIGDIKAARDAGAEDGLLAEARSRQRKAQFLIDFVEAENSMGFHAPGESLRYLGLALDHVRKGQTSLRGVATGATSPPAPESGAP